jgi:hypothetical protein
VSHIPAMRGRKVLWMGRPLPIGALMKSYKSASLYTVNLGESQYGRGVLRRAAHRLAALAVSITLPPPTLGCRCERILPFVEMGACTQGNGRNHVVSTMQLHLANIPRWAPSQRYRKSQTANPVEMRETRAPWVEVRWECVRGRQAKGHAIFIGGRLAMLESVKTATCDTSFQHRE